MSNDTAIESLQEKIDDLNQQAWDVRVTDLPKSFELSEESVKLARSINYPKGLAEGLRSLGFSYVRLSKNDEAAPLLKESLSLFQSLNDLKGQAVIYEYLGIIERNWGNLGASLDLLLKANELVLQIGSQEIEITCSYQLGVTYKHLGDHENALDYLYKTLSLAKKMNFTLMEAYATNIIGSIYFDNGNYNQALDCYQQGLPIRKQSHDKWGEAGSLDNIGFTYLKLNDLDKAIDHCKQSLAICQATGDKKGEANALLHLGEIYEQAGDIKQAAGFSNESLEIRKERGDKRGETEVLLFLAELYKNRSDVEDHQIFEWLSNALKIADEVKAQDLLSKTHYNLHEYYQQKGNFKESLAQLEAHFQIEKELHKNSINQKIANLEISHKAEVVSQRNKELTELNEKIEKANEELKIEATLERVRSRSMAMHKSEEVMDVAVTVYDELQKLDFKFGGATIIIMNKETGFMEHWLAGFIQKNHVESYQVNNIHHPLHAAQLAAWRKGEKFVSIKLSGDALKEYTEEMFTQTGYKNLPDEEKAMLSADEEAVFNLAYMSHGALMWAPSALSDEKAIILQRFAKVFEQTYTRFLDLQKAEAQAREAKIEAALEKVRSRSMAMHKSDELRDVVKVVFDKLQDLNFVLDDRAVGIFIFKDGSNDHTQWFADPDHLYATSFEIAFTDHSIPTDVINAKKSGADYFSKIYPVEEKNEYFNYLFANTDYKHLPGEIKDLILGSQHYGLSVAFAKNSAIVIPTNKGKLLEDNEKEILKRFVKVFDQAYTRFLDLQKAEAQARESQIELALERVRARTMAMQRSDELREAVLVIYEQLQQLNFESRACNIIIIDKESGSAHYWVSGFSEEIFPESYKVPYFNHPYQDALLNPWKQGDKYVVYEYTGQMKQSFDEIFFSQTEFRNISEEAKKVMIGLESVMLSTAFISYGALQTIGAEPLSEEKANILKRFAKVFEQTYTRFLDLQKAEAQARESQIEAVLERVRSRTMAMQKSDELTNVAGLLFEQVSALDIKTWTAGFNVWSEDNNSYVDYITSPQGGFIEPYTVYTETAEALTDISNARKSGVEFDVQYVDGEKIKQLYLALTKLDERQYEIMLQDGVRFPSHQYEHFVFGSKVSLMFITYEPVPEAHDIFKRLGKVFEQTYTRFQDLQKAEAQVRESQIEAALERVRSRTMGMQKSEELKEVIQVVYEQFVHLNINIEHTGFVMDYKARDDYDIWIADQLGVPSHVTIPYFDSVYYNRFNEAKKKGEDFFTTNLDFEEKNRFYKKLLEYVPGIPEETKEFLFNVPGLAASTVLLDNVCLYIENFSATPYTDEENATLMRFGKVFQQTYTRFNDLKLAEALAVQAKEDLVKLQTEKKRAEDALSELQVTQKQLIQSEKMASLGELTAGIAHEIQNPLNFVNNFSDVNKELLVEMKEEIEKGNTDEVIAIANDIISNEEKINHHGKRADAIVKGMLQHSRSSNGVKEPTDINELADEYLRLAYHGLRAKDKSFNATMKTDFDEKIGKVNVIPQEIGRVFLNLITNAFYVVAEKKKQLSNGYEPTVTVTTKKESDKVVVSVKDNGNGIPQKVLDKIFQPFFTTKPTGQGTGLGLSLSYDIVKAHSGEIKVKTKDGEGSEFVIQLPVV